MSLWKKRIFEICSSERKQTPGSIKKPMMNRLKEKKLKNKVLLSALILFSLCAIFVSDAYPQNDNSGTSLLSFFKLGAGAKAVGMGEAFTAQLTGVGSPFWNPSAISGIKRTQISFTHTQWVQDITAEHFSSAINTGENTFGLSFSLGKVPDIQKREGPTTEPLALFDQHDVVLSLTYARELRKKCAVGLSVKWIYEKIDISSAGGWGIDLGGICSPFKNAGKPLLENLKLGVAVLNLGSKMKFEKESYSLPTVYKAGLSWFAEKKPLQSDLTLNLDLVKPRDDDAKVHMGAEYGLYQIFNLRLGYQFGYDEKNLSFGMGVKYKKYAIDYAFLPYKSDLGDVHCVSLNIEF